MLATIVLDVPRALDANLFVAADRRDDPAAQAAWFDAHKHQVAGQILRMTGDPSVVDDLVQEVFIAAFRSMGEFRGDAQIETWLYRITLNKVRNFWDSSRRRRAREARAAEVTDTTVEGPDAHAEASDELVRFYAALGTLPTTYREAFVARAIDERSLEEASLLLGVPVSTVSYRARRAEALLRAALGFQEEP